MHKWMNGLLHTLDDDAGDAAAKNNRLIFWIQCTMRHRNSLPYHSFNELGENFICWNFEKFCEWEQFLSMETEVLIGFLKRDDLVIKDEFILFKCISKWLMHQLSKQQQAFVDERRSTGSSSYIDNEDSDAQHSFSALVTEVMSHIRFSLMAYAELGKVFTEPISEKYRHLFIDRVTQAMKFHAIGREKRAAVFKEMKADFGCDWSSFTPRLYTDDVWSSALVVENYSDVPSFTMRTFVFETATSLFEDELRAHHKVSSKRMRTVEATPVQEWAVCLYPKGVSFDRAMLISSHNATFIPSSQKDTVRIDVSTASPHTCSSLFKVGVLVIGRQDGLDFVRHVHVRRRYFQGEERVLKIEDLVSFDELNKTGAGFAESPLLIGDDRNTLRMQVVITPMQC